MEELKTMGLGIAWDDLHIGQRFRTVGRTITETDLVNFINLSGMVEVLFTNVEHTRRNADGSGGRLVPAALIYSMAEGLLIQAVLQGVGFAFLHMDMDIKGPAYVGDTFYVDCEVTECRASKGRPGLGLVRTRNRIVKQDGTVVMEYTPLRLLKGKDFTGD
jgi:acyl dehydratase